VYPLRIRNGTKDEGRCLVAKQDVKVTIQQRSDPQLRRLARALISLALRQLDEQAAGDERPGEAA